MPQRHPPPRRLQGQKTKHPLWIAVSWQTTKKCAFLSPVLILIFDAYGSQGYAGCGIQRGHHEADSDDSDASEYVTEQESQDPSIPR